MSDRFGLSAVVGMILFAGAVRGEPELPPPAASPELPQPRQQPATPAAPVAPQWRLDDVVNVGLQRNPRLAQAAYAIDAASGRALQAGLYPNPVFSFSADELGDRTGTNGILTPAFSQEIVTGGKLQLSRAAAIREVDQADLALINERYAVISTARQGYYEVLAVQTRVQLLEQMGKLADESVGTTEKLFKAKEVSKLDLLQLQVERERIRADLAFAKRERFATFRRLAASLGEPDLTDAALAASLDAPPPPYDFEYAKRSILANHPEIRSARVGIERAKLVLARAQVEPRPNLTVSTGYTRQNQNKSNDWLLCVSVPLPTWNRNQGNILAAQAQYGEAVQQVRRTENELVGRLATAWGTFSAARDRAAVYRDELLPAARESFQLASAAFQGGQFEYLRVVQAQRSIVEATLVYNQSLSEMWRAAAEISGLTLEDHWPPQIAAPAPTAVPAKNEEPKKDKEPAQG